MKKILYAVFALVMFGSLTACMVVPPYDAYGGPGVAVVVPAPYYGGYHGHHHYRDGGYRRW